MNLFNVGIENKQITTKINDVNVDYIPLNVDYDLKNIDLIINVNSNTNIIELYESQLKSKILTPSQILSYDFNKSIYDISGNKNNIYLKNNDQIDYTFDNGLKYNSYTTNIICQNLNKNNYDLSKKYYIYLEQIQQLDDYSIYDFYFNVLNTLPLNHIFDLIGIQISNSSFSSYNINITNSQNSINFDIGINNDYLNVNQNKVLNKYNLNIKTYVNFQTNTLYYNTITSSITSTSFLENNIKDYITINSIGDEVQQRINENIKINKLQIVINPSYSVTTSSFIQNYNINNTFIQNINIDKNNMIYETKKISNKYNMMLSNQKQDNIYLYSLRTQIDPTLSYLQSIKLDINKESILTYSQKTQMQAFIPTGDVE